MATRKVIDAKQNGEKVWLKGHAQATYMSNGSTVEDVINSIQSGGIKDNVYIVDFTMEELRHGAYDGVNVECQVQSLINAMNANKVILVRESTDSAYKGVRVLSGYAEDLLYFSIVDFNGEIIYCDGTDYLNNDSFILGDSLHVKTFDTKQDILVSGENIKTINGESVLGSGNITIESSGGTITGVSANGTSVATSGVANIPAASTSAYGVTKLSSATNSTSTTLAATASAVKAAYDLANSYKGTVTSVKIDGVSKSPSNGLVDLGYINKQLLASTSSSMILSPNIYYRNTSTSLSSLTITFAKESSILYNSLILNEYFVEFTISSSGTTVSFPSTIKWANGTAPTFEAGCTYQVSIVNNLGTYIKFA